MTLDENDAAHLTDMLEAGHQLLEIVGRATYKSLTRDRARCWAVERGFEVLGEAARGLSPGFRDHHAELPLAQVIGLRNVIAHGYSEVDHRVLLKVARDELPPLLGRLEALLQESPRF